MLNQPIHHHDAELVEFDDAAVPEEGTALDGGFTTVELLSWAAMSVVAIVAIGAALRVLGLDVISYVRTQLGL